MDLVKPHMVTVSHELNCHVISGSPPIGTGNSESKLLFTTTQQPAQQVQHVLGVSGPLRESRTGGGLFRGEANTSTPSFGENIRTVSLGYNIGKSMLCSTRTQRLDHYIRCLLKRGIL